MRLSRTQQKLELVSTFHRALANLIVDSSSLCACVMELSDNHHKNHLIEIGLGLYPTIYMVANEKLTNNHS